MKNEVLFKYQNAWIQHLYDVVEYISKRKSITSLAKKEELFFKLSNSNHYPSPEEYKIMSISDKRNHVLWWETEGRNDHDFDFIESLHISSPYT